MFGLGIGGAILFIVLYSLASVCGLIGGDRFCRDQFDKHPISGCISIMIAGIVLLALLGAAGFVMSIMIEFVTDKRADIVDGLGVLLIIVMSLGLFGYITGSDTERRALKRSIRSIFR